MYAIRSYYVYDKTERMIILKDCPTAVTDAEGSFRLESFAVLRDVSGQIQLFVSEEVLGDRYAGFGDLDAGDWIGATGGFSTWLASRITKSLVSRAWS